MYAPLGAIFYIPTAITSDISAWLRPHSPQLLFLLDPSVKAYSWIQHQAMLDLMSRAVGPWWWKAHWGEGDMKQYQIIAALALPRGLSLPVLPHNWSGASQVV